MNSVRRLTAVGSLTIGTLVQMLGLGVPTAFAASSYTSYEPNGSYTSSASNDAGRTTYYTDNSHYQIYDTLADRLAVGVLFYSQENQTFRLFHECDVGAGNNCPGNLPPGIAGPLCMATGVGRGTVAETYEYGQPVCFRVGP